MSTADVLSEIKGFLEGYNDELKYLVNVETNPNTNDAECVIHEPGSKPKIIKVKYTPFMFCKDFEKNKHILYKDRLNREDTIESKKKQYGIKITELKTGNHGRLSNGFCYKITSTKSYNAIIDYLRDGGFDPYAKKKDKKNRIIKDARGDFEYLHRDMFYSPRVTEQFFISTGARLFKGFEEYKDVHKVVFDIETEGLRYQRKSIFAIGVRDNRGFQIILEVKERNNNADEIKLIQDFFNLLAYLKPAIICGYNSEDFDFGFILGRAEILGIDKAKLLASLDERAVPIRRNNRATVKIGQKSIKYTSTQMWGYSIIDINHAAKRTAAINTELKNTRLKYIAQAEGIAREDRTYIEGDDGNISNFYFDNKMFVADEKNVYKMVPDDFQEISTNLYKLIVNKQKLSENHYSQLRTTLLKDNPDYVKWFRENAVPLGMTKLINGKKLVKQYLLEDLWETEQVDELYNQSSFMLAKIVPTTYQRICTMGTASVWNLLLTAWSYDNDIAVPFCEAKERFSGGLSRCYKIGFSKKWSKIDYASLYPMIQLNDDVFPMFDITGVIKKMLLYLTTTRNIYKKLANKDEINENEIYILSQIDHDSYKKYIDGTLTDHDRAMFKVKQLPIKILNNSLFGALGAGIAFNWSDNICAARITCTGRLHLRHAISWFGRYNCIPLLAITDGVNFQIPDNSNILIGNNDDIDDVVLGSEIPIEEAWKFNGKVGISALIDKYNDEVRRAAEKRGRNNFISVDNDGDFISCLNLSRNNYTIMFNAKNKKTGKTDQKIKLVGNNVKSKSLPEYIDEFFNKGLRMILEGKGSEFVDYYYDYIDLIYYERIPLKKIASKHRVITSIAQYQKRGKDKNGKEKARQAHMELLIKRRNDTATALFETYKDELLGENANSQYTIEEKLRIISDYMPPEPELDSTVYLINIGTLTSHGNSGENDKTHEGYSALIDPKDLANNPEMTGKYNVAKYLDNFNKKVGMLLSGFDTDVAKQIIVKITTKKTKDIMGKIVSQKEMQKNLFTREQLSLRNFDLDSVSDSMYMESDEIKFWNRSGYDPKLIWDGFSERESEKINYEVYSHALEYLNSKMRETGKNDIKSVNDSYVVGDLLLFKDYSKYFVMEYNGISFNIIRDVTDKIPLSDYEIKMAEEKKLLDEKIDKLELSDNNADPKKKTKKDKYFDDFKSMMDLDEKMTYKHFIKEYKADGKEMFDDYVDGLDDDDDDDEPAAYIDIDYDR